MQLLVVACARAPHQAHSVNQELLGRGHLLEALSNFGLCACHDFACQNITLKLDKWGGG